MEAQLSSTVQSEALDFPPASTLQNVWGQTALEEGGAGQGKVLGCGSSEQLMRSSGVVISKSTRTSWGSLRGVSRVRSSAWHSA